MLSAYISGLGAYHKRFTANGQKQGSKRPSLDGWDRALKSAEDASAMFNSFRQYYCWRGSFYAEGQYRSSSDYLPFEVHHEWLGLCCSWEENCFFLLNSLSLSINMVGLQLVVLSFLQTFVVIDFWGSWFVVETTLWWATRQRTKYIAALHDKGLVGILN